MPLLNSEIALFLASWVRNPRRVGSVLPSSDFLARAMAAQVNPFGSAPVVELGAGTGAITQALLEHGLPPERLVVVELDGRLHQLLSHRFPGVRVLRGNALELRGVLRRAGVATISAVVSSVPLLAMPLRQRLRLLRHSLTCLDEGGPFVQYTYGPFSPLPCRHVAALGLRAEAVAWVLRNIPPATVWRYEPRAADPRRRGD